MNDPAEIIKDLIELAEHWINREDTRGMSECDYTTWLATGHKSKAMRAAKDYLRAQPEQEPSSMCLCKDHGGYGFTSDCRECIRPQQPTPSERQ